ncbi:hypothetical protein ABZ876_14510 [Streptomyces sp. NPDC046931]|uniref:SpnB-like Rossmann fold domain-containing protein n=1 Tax=Streptomyces sp. NPDC046931 TaxID=3154806 RepID=UPI00340AC4B5
MTDFQGGLLRALPGTLREHAARRGRKTAYRDALRFVTYGELEEYPGRLTLVDVDDRPESLRPLPAAVATGEPQLAVHGGVVSVPRLMPSPPSPTVARSARAPS